MKKNHLFLCQIDKTRKNFMLNVQSVKKERTIELIVSLIRLINIFSKSYHYLIPKEIYYLFVELLFY
jgi:hypothetical protein